MKNTLEIKAAKDLKPIPSWVFGSLLAGVFVGVIGLAMLTGNWHNSISHEEYQKRFKELNAPAYEHFGARGH